MKIKCKLIYSSDNNQYKQKLIFDENILEIKENVKIKTKTPLVSISGATGFAFMITNKHKYQIYCFKNQKNKYYQTS